MVANNAQYDELAKKLKHLRDNDQIPKERKPKVLVCGKTGVGKTTAINTLFGEEVGSVGHFARGTSEDAIYEWESDSENIRIVDLPGLGDSYKNDKIFREIYREQVKDADGFIVMVSPPRPAEEGTLRTVRLLLQCGVPSKHIVFGYNKLSYLQYPNQQGKIVNIEIDGLIGPSTKKHSEMISLAKQAFYNDLKQAFPRRKFYDSQIVEFDSISGWNLHAMLFKVVEILPFETLAMLRRAARQASREAKKKEEERLRKEREAIEKQKIILEGVKDRMRSKEEERKRAERFRQDEMGRQKEKQMELETRERAIRIQEDELRQKKEEEEKRKTRDEVEKLIFEEAKEKARPQEEMRRKEEKKQTERLRQEEIDRRREKQRKLEESERGIRKQEEELRQKREEEELQRIREEMEQMQQEIDEQKRRAEERERALSRFEEKDKAIEERIVDTVFKSIGVVVKVAFEIGKRLLGWG